MTRQKPPPHFYHNEKPYPDMNVKPKKALGQHFLIDLSIARRIAYTLDTETLPAGCAEWGKLPILEVGPGTGVLTKYLLATGREFLAVELDQESVDFLREIYPDMNLLHTDFLRLQSSGIFPDSEQFALIGNYPYNISSQIFFKLLEMKERVPVCAGMLQREVAQRICAAPGSKTYGILSVLLQIWYDCEYLFTVDEIAFNPPPKVKSGVIRLLRNGRTSLPCKESDLKLVVKTAFGQRRKTLRNSLAGIIGNDSSITKDDEIMSKRPEQLSPEEFIDLTCRLRP